MTIVTCAPATGPVFEADPAPDVAVATETPNTIKMTMVAAHARTTALGTASAGAADGRACPPAPSLAGRSATTVRAANAPTSITPATIPAVVRISLKSNSPIHSDRR